MAAPGQASGEALVAAGLECYAAGDLRGALEAWERALRLSPDDARAREYINYVRENYAELQAQFEHAHQVERQAEADGVPVIEAADDPEAYASIDISSGDFAVGEMLITDDELSPPGELLDLADDHGEEETAVGAETAAPPAQPRPPMLSALRDLPLRAGQAAPRPAPAPALAAASPPLAEDHVDLPTDERGMTGLLGLSDAAGEFDTEFSDAPRTSERPVPGVIVDDVLLGAFAGSLDPELEHTNDLSLPHERPIDALRRRTVELLRSAEEAAERADYAAAVAAVETAVDEDDGGVVAPGLLFERRDLVYRIYEGHIGDLTQVPLVAVPLHEIAAQNLNHRTGFLLSRIDGMLSFEDILDVAGMPRMEAYKILSGLLRKGVIEVR